MTMFKLGKLAPKIGDGHTVKLAAYLAVPLPVPPASIDWTSKLPADLGMMLNADEGDCTFAGAGHGIQVTTANAGPVMVTVPDDAIQTGYVALTGFDPATGANDTGCVETDVLTYWRQTGIGGHKIIGSGTVDHTDVTEVKQAVALLGFLYLGIQVPKAWQSGPDVWDVPKHRADKVIVGGHCIIAVGYDDRYIYIVSWGRVYKMTWDAFKVYCDEAHGVVSPEWVAANGLSPSGLNLAGLTSDLDALAA